MAREPVVLCPYCQGPSSHLFFATDRNQRTQGSFEYRLCSSCLLRFIRQVPESLQTHYVNEQYDVPPTSDAFKERARSQQWKVEILANLTPSGELFEVGPATGEFLFMAREAGYQPVAAEMDEACCRFIRQGLGIDVSCTNDPNAALMKLGKFQAICIWQAIEHIPRFWDLVETALARLNVGGVMVVSTPNPDSFQARILGRYWPHLDAPRHLYLIPPAWFDRLASTHGCSVVLKTTTDVGSLGLNYYGWYLFARNALGRSATEERAHAVGRFLTNLFRGREETEGAGCSYTIALRKSPAD